MIVAKARLVVITINAEALQSGTEMLPIVLGEEELLDQLSYKELDMLDSVNEKNSRLRFWVFYFIS